MNESEQWVHKLATSSFLSMWTFETPHWWKGGQQKELCDCLVVCGEDVVVISVKEPTSELSGDVQVDWNRWKRKAVEDSAKQLYGARKALERGIEVLTASGEPIQLPAPSQMRIQLVAVALGNKTGLPFEWGDLGKGYIHVLDEISFSVLMSELDTISDILSYLNAKTQLETSGVHILYGGGWEEDLMTLFLSWGPRFGIDSDNAPTLISIAGDLWNGFKEGPDYKQHRVRLGDSYLWDQIIEEFAGHVLGGTLLAGSATDETELSLRYMVREPRAARVTLAQALAPLLQRQGQEACRIVRGTQALYIYQVSLHTRDRRLRSHLLWERCVVASHGVGGQVPVIGICTEPVSTKLGNSFDLILVDGTNWSKSERQEAAKLRRVSRHFQSFTAAAWDSLRAQPALRWR